ncbi:MAG TPA: hypothetical protein VHX90_02530, partial [Verrucomicrobiae bacterium]|nr:hypothetical protein [Verrucomicrobiae bacterium]
RKLTKAQKISGQSINQLVMLCVRRALPEVVSAFATESRLTNIDPLSAATWRKIYRRKDELYKISAKQLAAFQSRETPE